MKTAIVDLNCPIGHLNFIKFYLDKINKKKTLFFLNSNVRSFLSYKKTKYFKVLGIAHLFITYLKIVFFIKKKKIKSVIFLSYNYQFYFIISYILKFLKIKNIIIEHDSIRNRFKNNFLQNLISKRTIRLTYTNQIKDFIKKKYEHNKVYKINFPVLKDNIKYNNFYKKKNKITLNKNKINILVPNRFNLDLDYAKYIFTKFNNYNFYIVSKKLLLNQNCFFIESFNAKEINNFDIVFLPINHSIYNLRLSSWIYKTIAYNKFVLIKKSLTFRNEMFFFKEYLCNEYNLKKKLNNKTSKKKDFNKYNLECLSQLECFLEE